MSLLADIAKNSALAVPWIRRKRGEEWLRGGYDENTNQASYVRGVFDKHRTALERYRLINGPFLEIGPGGNIATAGLFVQAGASEAVCIDVVPWVDHVQPLYDELGFDGDVLSRIRYECPCPIETAPFPDDSFEIIISNASYQKFTDPRAATRNIARMLRPGGVTSHQIDLRDNRDFSRPLEFLKVGDLAWRLSRSRRSPTNRWRASDIQKEFSDAGLQIHDARVTRQTEVTEAMAASFKPRFRDKTLEDLGTLGLFLVASKPPLARGVEPSTST